MNMTCSAFLKRISNTISLFFIRLILLLIGWYRNGISPLLPPSCRYHPTCSAYAEEAVRTHGPWRGVGLAVYRICRCHPFRKGGYDPVPPPRGDNGDAVCQP
jgi:uncharacterized protein